MLLEVHEGLARWQMSLDERAVPANDARAPVAIDRLAGEDPRSAERAAADHHRGAPGRRDQGARVVVRLDVAVAGDREADGGHDLADDVPGRAPGVLLRARAGMDRDRVHTLRFGEARDLDRVDRALVPTRADLDRERAGDGRHRSESQIHGVKLSFLARRAAR